jgi:predicted dehydrogenase
MPTTHIGLVGCGRWGAHILRDLRQLGCRVTVVAASADSTERARAGGADEIVDKPSGLPEVDGLVVATPTFSHAEVVDELLDRGVPIFVEKPLTSDAASAARLARDAPGQVFVMHKWRYHPGIEELGRIARSGELGRVVGLRTFRLGWGLNHTDVDALWILLPHDMSIALEVLGEIPEPRQAVAERMAGRPTGLVGLLGDDPWFTVEASITWPARRREVRLHCEDGVAILPDAYSDAVEVYRRLDPEDPAAPEPERHPISTEFPLVRELRAFVEYLGGGQPPKSGVEEAAADVAAIAALRRLAGVD